MRRAKDEMHIINISLFVWICQDKPQQHQHSLKIILIASVVTLQTQVEFEIMHLFSRKLPHV